MKHVAQSLCNRCGVPVALGRRRCRRCVLPKNQYDKLTGESWLYNGSGTCEQIAEVLGMPNRMAVFRTVNRALRALRALPESRELYRALATSPKLENLLCPPDLEPLLEILRQVQRWLMLADIIELEAPEEAGALRGEAKELMKVFEVWRKPKE